MLRRLFSILTLSAAVGLSATAQAQAETKVGTNIDSRVIVGVATDGAAVQDFLPDGWSAMAFPQGPLKGANLLVSFVDGVLMTDAEGKPLAPASRRALVLLSLAKEDGGKGVRIFVLRTYSTEPPEVDPYGVNLPATLDRAQSLSGPADGGRSSLDTWTLNLGEHELAMTLNYTTGRRGWSASEAKSFSAANPDFYRIYRYDSLTDVAMSAPLGKPLAGDYSLTTSIPELQGLLGGDEDTVAILDIPIRVREVYLP